VSLNQTSVTFAHVDPADEGFPGTVEAQARAYLNLNIHDISHNLLRYAKVTHSVSNGGVLHTSLKASASEKTPIMTTQHIYW
jgi:aldose 1-epimerase